MERKNHLKFLILILLSFLIILPIFNVGAVNVEAKERASHTDVLEDLRKDENFNPEAYPEIENDYSIDVFQIAESTDNKLLIYVYQPNPDTMFTATSINLSTEQPDNPIYKNYKLTILSANGVFSKYSVDDLTISDVDSVRYYDVSAIFRKFDKNVDAGLPDYNENKIDYKGFLVGKIFSAYELDGNITYFETSSEVIEITSKYVGFLIYKDYFHLWGESSCSAFYVAFDTDKKIDKLIEADIHYVTQQYTHVWESDNFFNPNGNEIYGDKTTVEKTLLASEEETHTGTAFFSKKYTWNRIEKVDTFTAKENLTDEAKEDLKNHKWILRFHESAYVHTITDGTDNFQSYEYVSEVMILRLKFETNGQLYNLGVVDDIQSLGENQTSDNKDNRSFGKTLLYIIIGIICIILLIIFLPFILTSLPKWIELILMLLKVLIKIIIKIICMPFKFIIFIIRKIKGA